MDNEKLNNENNEQNLENNSAQMDHSESYTTTVKQSWFEQIKERLTRPRLGTGSKVQTTGQSLGMWSLKASVMSAVSNIMDKVSNAFKKPEPEIKNTLAATVIGQTKDSKDVSKDTTKNVATQELRKQTNTKGPTIIIAGTKPARQNIINNSIKKDVEAPESEKGSEESIDIGTIETSGVSTEKTVQQPASQIEGGDIIVATQPTKVADSKQSDDREM